jgi:hypothetical protein
MKGLTLARKQISAEKEIRKIGPALRGGTAPAPALA